MEKDDFKYQLSFGVDVFGGPRWLDLVSAEEADGYVKVLTDATTDRLLGVHILGPRASDLIAECVTVMEYHGSAEDIARCTHAHPTLGETVGDAARMAYAGLPVNF